MKKNYFLKEKFSIDQEKEVGLQFPDYAHIGNLEWIEGEYKTFLKDPSLVDVSWRRFFEGMQLGVLVGGETTSGSSDDLKTYMLIDAYRRYGHLASDINPLKEKQKNVPELALSRFGFQEKDLDITVSAFGLFQEKVTLRKLIEKLGEIYCNKIAFEYMDLGNLELELWIQKEIEKGIEKNLSIEEKKLILEMLNASEVMETFLHTRYVGQTRFSLEGNETTIPILGEMVDYGASIGIDEVWIGMAHRGRLNVLANIMKKPYRELFSSFENDTSLSFFGNDDVKYHMGFFSEIKTKSGKKVSIGMPPNPSHLESVDPVLLGVVRGKQTIKKDPLGKKTLPIMIHGDAAVAGQGVVYETLQLCKLPGYQVGGTIHLVLNNQIGYTTLATEGRSTRYCTDIAKTFGMPVIHVNAEAPESALFAAKLAVMIREKFQSDVFIDLIGYRKYGHNEGDEPSFTQPVEYQLIRSKPSIRDVYLMKLMDEGMGSKEMAIQLESEFKQQLQEALSQVAFPEPESIKENVFIETVETKVSSETIDQIVNSFCTIPEGFHLHPKLQKWLEERKKKGKIDWSWGEAFAFSSLLIEKKRIRFAGQDVQRGTFSQRHLIWSDSETGIQYSPLSTLGSLEIVNSPLTEYAGMGFEYGYSSVDTDALTLWEAQYGDFDNGAQIIIDQYIASGDQKWGTKVSIVLLLPHAYEGAGPEHSSARLERFLQLAAKNNFLICNLSTPAQYFHALRAQVLRKEKRPLILFTPKSLLRNPAMTSSVEEFTQGRFQQVLSDPKSIASPKSLIFTSGKMYYDLSAARKPDSIIRIARVEQFYPFPKEEIKKQIDAAQVDNFYWVQEEPKNMGAWSWIHELINPLLPSNKSLIFVGREENATPSTGSHQKHKLEQKALIDLALKDDV